MSIKPPIVINPSSNSTGNVVDTYTSPSYEYISTAPRDNITDAQPHLQADINYCVAQHIPILRLLPGLYKITKPLLIYRDNGVGGYGQVTLKLVGESSMWDSYNVTSIRPTFGDTFAIGIQQGKGCTIEGINIAGIFNAPVVSDRVFYNRELSEVTDGVCRNSRYSPYSGIVIDPFTNGQIPEDGGYPAMTSYYKGTGGNAGSTATTINKVSISKFQIGIASSINGSTQNAEITTISNVQFAYCPVWVAGGQAQEKANVIFNVAGWSETHTAFDFENYGLTSKGHWSINNVNIAGRCNRLISNENGGWFPANLTNIFAEGLGQLGFMGSDVSASLSNSSIDFTDATIGGYRKSYISARNIRFTNCTFRFYGQSYCIPISTNQCVFDNCTFTGIPLQISEASPNFSSSQFRNCMANGHILGCTDVKRLFINQPSMYSYGNFSIEEANMINYGVHLNLKNTSYDTYARFSKDNTIAITVASNSFSFTSTAPAIYTVGQAVSITNDAGTVYYFGLVSAISSNTITVNNCTEGLVSGTYNISSYYPVYTSTFIGDITSGSNQITNVKNGWGSVSVGVAIKSTYSNDRYLLVTAVSGTTVTVSSILNTTTTGAYFGGNTTQEIWTDNPSSTVSSIGNVIVGKGDIIKIGGNSGNSTAYKITQAGWISPPSGDTRQATWQLL